MRACRRHHGLTLIEIIVALAIVGVLAAIAMPSLREFVLQQRLKATANELLADMQLARSTALGMAFVPNFVNVGFRTGANQSCYSIAVVTSATTQCDCTREVVCQFAGQGVTPPLRQVAIDTGSGIAVTGPVKIMFGASGMPIDHAESTITVTASSGATLNVIIGPTGFPRLCAPQGTNISGITTCL
jgi:type IV fimbrial biogenesis protein FimT